MVLIRENDPRYSKQRSEKSNQRGASEMFEFLMARCNCVYEAATVNQDYCTSGDENDETSHYVLTCILC